MKLKIENRQTTIEPLCTTYRVPRTQKYNAMNKLLLFINILCFILTSELSGQSFKMAIDMDGIDDYALVPHDESLNPGTDSWTIALWLNAPNVEQDGPLVRKRLAEEGYNQFNLLIGHTDPHNPSPGKGIIYNYIDYAGVSERSGHLQNEFVDGNWHHIAVVSDKTADSVFVFIDGIKQVFNMQYNFGDWPDVTNVDSMLIGRDSGGSDFYTGKMDELSIWRKALNNAQILQVMTDTLSTSYYSSADSGLVAYYRFDALEDLGINGGGADDFRDFSFYGNHADADGDPELVPSLPIAFVPEELADLEFFVYPNPCQEKLTLHCSALGTRHSELEVINLSGNVVYKEENTRSGEAEITVDVSHLPAGLYLVMLQTEDAVGVRKIIKR